VGVSPSWSIGTSSTTPTIVRYGGPPFGPNASRSPTADLVPNCCVARARLTTITRGAFHPSCGVKSRPRKRRMPIARK
jgi:hypothetical protein